MDDSSGDSGCPHCGDANDGRCPHCGGGGGDDSTALRVLEHSSPPASGPSESRVRLLREYKGPTVQELMASPEQTDELLPGQVCGLDGASPEGDDGGASGRVLHGPGYSRRRAFSLMLPTLLWLWFGLLLCLVVWVVS